MVKNASVDKAARLLYNLAMRNVGVDNKREATVLNAVKAFLDGYRGKKIAVAVSGGRDSVCLLDAVCAVFSHSDISVAHVHHGLRESADRDMNFVRELCRKYDLPFLCYKVDARAESEKKGLTVEQAARSLRYGIFYSLISNGDADYVLTAHHALDNAESVLMHLFRGAGLDGLSGIEKAGGRVLRPLLDITPAELDNYVEANGLNYVTDETNLSDEADRNFIRLNVLPLVEKRYAGATRAINALSKEARAACEFIDGSLNKGVIGFDGEAVTLPTAALKSPLGGRYVREAMRHFSLTDLTRAQVNDVLSLADKDTGALVNLNLGVVAAKEYGAVALYIPRKKCEDVAPFGFGFNTLDGLAVDVTEGGDKNVPGAADFYSLDGAELRFRRDGDYFTPFGGGRKKLKDYFIDKKIPARLRDRIPLVCRGNEVILVVGVAISESVKITDGTTRVCTVTRRY